MNKEEIIAALNNTADLLEINGENPFRIRAYNRAVELISSSSLTAVEFLNKCRAGEVSGIGPQLLEAMEMILERGTFSLLEELKAKYPKGILELFAIRGLGAKKIGRLYKELGIGDLGTLKQACLEQKLQTLKGFSSKSEASILEAISEYARNSLLFLFRAANNQAIALKNALANCKEVRQVEIVGTLS